MSYSFSFWQFAIFSLATLGLWLVARRRLYLRKNRYIGYGWMLEFNKEKLGPVIVRARLIKSPAGRVGIPNGALLLVHAGVKMEFDSGDAFQAWIDSRGKPKKGDELKCLVSYGGRDYEVTMHAEVIQGPIPTYGRWPERETGWELIHTRDELWVCPKTGALYERRFFVDI